MGIDQELQTAVTAIRAQRLDEAIAVLSGILNRRPDHANARWLLIQVFENQGEREQALQHVAAFLQNVPDDLEAINRMAAYLHQRAWPLDTATDAYRVYLDDHSDDANAAFNLAFYLGKDGEFEPAVAMFQRALDLGIDAPEEAQVNIANICMDHLYENERAQSHLERALELNPRYKGAWYNLGNLAERLGDRERAQTCFEKCLELDPQDTAALARLGEVHRFRSPRDPLLDRLRAAAPASRNSSLHFALGRAYDRLGDYDAAWRQFTKANHLDRKHLAPYDPVAIEKRFSRIISTANASWLSRFPGDSHSPIFICGMFRTGSTLLEQMLGAHPAIKAGGEQEYFARLVNRRLADYPSGLEQLTTEAVEGWRADHSAHCERLTKGAMRLTDKRPDNFLFVGLIKAIIPAARFVVTERDWRDVALSIFSNRFGAGQNYATRLQDIRHYLGQHARLVDHWAEVLGNDLLRVRYADLVADPRGTLGGLLEALDLAWDDRCLAFNRPGRSVNTASAWQVREPLYSTSIGRWRNYEMEFRKAFGDAIGP